MMGLCNEDLVSKVFVLETSLTLSHSGFHSSVQSHELQAGADGNNFCRADKRIKGQASSILIASSI